MKLIKVCLPFFLILLISTSTSFAQTGEGDLTATILHLDSAFWKAYNTCDTAAYRQFFTDDVEFYHDKGGITLGAPALIKSLGKNLCSNNNYRLRREAVAGTVEVYPMEQNNQTYGAIITGEHKFYITQNGKPEYLDGQANFTHLWIKQNGEWKMKRVLSYNHHAVKNSSTRKEITLPQEQLDQWAGSYNSEQFGKMDVARKGNVLQIKSAGKIITLYPLSATKFFTKERDLVFEFVKDASDTPLKMTVIENGAIADELPFEK